MAGILYNFTRVSSSTESANFASGESQASPVSRNSLGPGNLAFEASLDDFVPKHLSKERTRM